MAGREATRSSEHLITGDARVRLRSRLGVGDWVEQHPRITTGFASLLAGGGTYVSFQLGGLATRDALVVGAAVAATVFLFFVVASWLRGAPVVPAVFEGANEPAELDEEVRFPTESEAGREATRRNLREGSTGAYWIETELPSGEWTVALRGRRRTPRAADGAHGGWLFFGGDFGGGGGGDGGGGGGGG